MARSSGRAADALAIVLLGALCFACVFAAVFYVTFRIWVHFGDTGAPEFPTVLWAIPTAAGVGAAVIGPLLLRNPSSSK